MQPFANVLQNKCSNKFFDIHKKISVLQSLFNKVTGLMACIFITTQVFSRRKVTRRKKCGMRPYIYDVHSKSRWQVLKVVMYLWILLFLNNSSIVEFYGRSGWEGDHNIGDKCMTPKLVIFYDVHVSWMQEKIHHGQGQRHFIKCAHRKTGCRLIVVRTHIN